jgi:uncharacterized LabA/DUF88 family protein
MVDAGYLLRQSIEIVSGRVSTKRSELDITDPAGLVKALLNKSRSALELTDRELLRVYWYDGVMSGGLTPQQRAIMDLPDVHFRSGTVNSAGQQKGVDSLIVTDLVELAANHAMSDAALVTGDSDLAVGIELSQKKGVRISVIGVEDLAVGVSHKQSFEITTRADRIGRLGSTELGPVMRYVPTSLAGSPSTTTNASSHSSSKATPATSHIPHVSAKAATISTTPVDKQRIDQSVQKFVAQQASMAGAVDPSTKRIDANIDRALIHHVYTELSHGPLTTEEKNYARTALRSQLGVQ